MNQLISVDVILPFHETNAYLFQAIDSVRNSKGIRVRLILVDDRKESSDLSMFDDELGNNFEDVIIVKNIKHGYANSLNTGIELIKSEYVALMNSDDLISEDKLIHQISSLKNTASEVCIGTLRKFSKRGTLPTLSGTIRASRYRTEFLLLGAYGADASIAMTLKAAEIIKFHDGVRSSDWATAFTFYPRLKICGNDSAVYWYRIHEQQTTSQKLYREESFSQIYVYWAKYNSELGLPELDMDTSRVLAASQEFKPRSDIDREALAIWIRAYLNLFSNQHESLIAKELIKRRLIILGLREKRLTRHVLLTFRLFCEYLFMLAKGSKPR